jgi:flagellar hook-length control protein FliK
MQATSAAPSPVLPSPNSAGPIDPQSADASVAGAEGKETSPFATVLGKQMKAPTDKPDASAAPTANAKKLAALSAVEASKDVPADAIAILAAMLTGVTVPAQAAASSDAAANIQATATAADADEAGPDPATVIATALPVAIPVTSAVTISTKASTQVDANANPLTISAETPTATDGGSSGARDATQPFALVTDSPASAGAPAIVAADAAVRRESSAESGNNASTQDSKFGALLDAARAAGDNAAGQSSSNATAALATSTHAAPAPHATNAATTQIPVATPVGAEGWNHEIGEKVTWMVNRQTTHADLVLNPPQLGRIEVSLSMNGDQASATFVSANPAVRDALENAMPHLREVLQGAGISLGQTQVGAESFQQSANGRESGDNSSRGNTNDNRAGDASDNGLATAGSASTRWLKRGNGLVDTFA